MFSDLSKTTQRALSREQGPTLVPNHQEWRAVWGTRPAFPARRLGVGDPPTDNSEVSVSLSVK